MVFRMAISKEQLDQLTPCSALKELKEGNQRFVEGRPSSVLNSQLMEQTKDGQYPKAIVISCIDSRVPVEQIFDQHIGDIFVARVAGNFINEDILASIEYACVVAGSPLIVVLGHEGCGAIKSACDDVRFGHITKMLQAISPAVEDAKKTASEPFNSSNSSFVSSVTQSNVLLNIQKIIHKSESLNELNSKGKIAICGGIYSINNGIVNWL